MNTMQTYKHYQALHQQGLKPPVTEADYDVLHEFMQDLTSRNDINEQPWSDLFGLVASYMHEWELDNQPELKITHLEPFERLKFLMERRGVTQYQLAKEGIMSQGNLSNILAGKKGISKELAKKLAKYFGISIGTFI